MKQLQPEAPKPRKSENPFRKYIPLATGAAIISVMTLSPFAGGQPRAADQCTASVQSGSIPSYHSRGRGVHLISAPLMRDGRYLSLSMPDRYMDNLTSAARRQPEGQRSAFVRDAVHRNIETAITRIGSGDRATFDCVSASASASPSVSASTVSDAGASEQAPPVVSADAGPRPSSDAGSPERRRTISPGQ